MAPSIVGRMHRLGLYYQDKHPLPYLLEVAEYAEDKGFSEIWPADTRRPGLHRGDVGDLGSHPPVAGG
jgi:alkanesulfonate monooxygenase SsuD/methylene tetrahydromethanopterin reductase-like flavin-dependent oxidoreductase (luciferase family)